MEVMDSFRLKQELPFSCQYCNAKCIKEEKGTKRHWWWHCDQCNANFLVSTKGFISVIEFKTPFQDDKFYSVNIMLKSKKTDIHVWYPDLFLDDEEISNYRPVLIKSFNQILDLNPRNIQSKIKTILTFL